MTSAFLRRVLLGGAILPGAASAVFLTSGSFLGPLLNEGRT
ncbi:MAG: hypothetical protein FD160_2436 [Caulobacteraceae bacterium]|nr:MAG: hypothetical protein FD160_2436 [Caulobacteraceae bacterium]